MPRRYSLQNYLCKNLEDKEGVGGLIEGGILLRDYDIYHGGAKHFLKNENLAQGMTTYINDANGFFIKVFHLT